MLNLSVCCSVNGCVFQRRLYFGMELILGVWVLVRTDKKLLLMFHTALMPACHILAASEIVPDNKS